eukprot:461064_1
MADETKPLTEEQKQGAIKAAYQLLDGKKENLSKIEDDKSNFHAMISAVRQSNPYYSGDKQQEKKAKDNKPEDEGNDDDEKKGDDAIASSELTKLWDAFKKAAKEVGDWAHDFLEKLKAAPLKDDTKREIANLCREYNDLLVETASKLQLYRKDVEKIMIVFTNVLSLMIPPENIQESLKNLSKKEKIGKINDFAEKNKESLKKQLGALQKQMSNEESINDLMELREKWNNMTKKIEEVLHKVEKDMKAFRKKMAIIFGCAFVFAAVVGAVAMVFTGGAAGAAVLPLLGILGTFALGAAAVIAITGVAFLGVAMMIEPEIAKALKLVQNKTTKAISNGLANLAANAQTMKDILSIIYLQWQEIAHTEIENTLLETAWSLQCDHLISVMAQTKNDLQCLKRDIEETEKVVKAQIATYSEKVYKPLLQLYTS